MRRSILFVAAVCAASVPVFAQAPMGPPPVLLMNREEIKPGRIGAHDKDSAKFAAIARKTSPGMTWVALKPLTGDDNSRVYLQGLPSFAAFEEMQEAFDKGVAQNAAYQAELDQMGARETHASQRSALYVYRADLSYRAQTMEEFARSRFVGVTVTRVKPGRGADYVAWLKELNAARERAGIADVQSAVYSVVSGAPAGIFVSFRGVRSLKDWDAFGAAMEARNKAVDAALGGDEAVRRRRMAYSEAVVDSTNTLYRLDAGLSNPDAQFASYDPSFWTPAAAMASGKVPAVKKQTKKN